MNDDATPLSIEPPAATQAGLVSGSTLQQPAEATVPRPPTSTVLAQLADGLEGETIALADLTARLGERAFGMVILLPALVNLIPNVPGLTTMFGLIMFVPSLQMALGRRQLWMPASLARRQISVARVKRLIELGLPQVRRLERYLRPRWSYLTYPPWESLVGVALCLLCLFVAAPIPGSNLFPGIAVLMIALGMVERDGLIIIAGIALGAVAALVVGFLLTTAFRAAGLLIGF